MNWLKEQRFKSPKVKTLLILHISAISFSRRGQEERTIFKYIAGLDKDKDMNTADLNLAEKALLEILENEKFSCSFSGWIIEEK